LTLRQPALLEVLVADRVELSGAFILSCLRIDMLPGRGPETPRFRPGSGGAPLEYR